MSERVPADAVLASIEDVKRQAGEHGYSGRGGFGWFTWLTGQPLNGSAWEQRIVRARRRGWIAREHEQEWFGLVEAATQRDPSVAPEATTRVGRIPRLPSEPLREALRHHHRAKLADRFNDRRSTDEGVERLRTEELIEADELTIYRADELCVKHLRTHPATIYGNAWWRAIGEEAA